MQNSLGGMTGGGAALTTGYRLQSHRDIAVRANGRQAQPDLRKLGERMQRHIKNDRIHAANAGSWKTIRAVAQF